MRTVLIAFLLTSLCLTTTAFGNPRAGFMTTDATLSVGTVPITVWYPTSNRVKGPSEYIVPAYQYLDFPYGPPVELRIPAGATRNAPIKGGIYPLILSNPGGESGNHMRLRNYPNNELLAAQGYIVVEAGRLVTNPFVDADLLKGLIDHMLGEHALSDSVDASEIGARGLSFGGFAVAALAGWLVPIAPDPRVRGIIIDEAVNCDPSSFFDCSAVTIPVLLRDGSPLGDGSGQAPAFAGLVNAIPRFLVTLDNPAHIGFNTGQCGNVEAMRVASLAFQLAAGGVVEPEPRNLSYVLAAGASHFDTAGGSAGLFWNLNFFAPGLGSAGDFCRSEYGGPAPIPATPGVMDNQTMIATKHPLNLAFWETVFGNGRSNNLVEKAAQKLDSVTSFSQVAE